MKLVPLALIAISRIWTWNTSSGVYNAQLTDPGSNNACHASIAFYPRENYIRSRLNHVTSPIADPPARTFSHHGSTVQLSGSDVI